MSKIIDMEYSDVTNEWFIKDQNFDSKDTFVQDMLNQLAKEYLESEFLVMKTFS